MNICCCIDSVSILTRQDDGVKGCLGACIFASFVYRIYNDLLSVPFWSAGAQVLWYLVRLFSLLMWGVVFTACVVISFLECADAIAECSTLGFLESRKKEKLRRQQDIPCINYRVNRSSHQSKRATARLRM
jgi:hypothetical protein